MVNQRLFRTVAMTAAMSLAISTAAFGFSGNGNGANNVFMMNGNNMNQSTGFQQNQQNNTNKYASFMSQNGIMQGDGNGNFNLEGYVKRGDIMLMIVSAFKLSSNDAKDNFADVTETSYYFDAIATTKSLGVTKGDGKNFNPEKYVTIEEAISLINRSIAVANSNVAVDEDADLEDLFSDSDGSQYATRGQIAEMLYYVLTGDTDYDSDDYSSYGQYGYSQTSLNTISYSTDDGEAEFDEEDFAHAFEDATDGEEDLYSVEFTLPSNSYGRLYYYGELLEDDEVFYIDNDPNISDLGFVPSEDFEGSVSIKYTAVGEEKTSAGGYVKITVEDEAVELSTIKYTVDIDDEFEFDEDEIIEVFEDETGDDIDRIILTPPSSSFGDLYYDGETLKSPIYIDVSYISELSFEPEDEGTVSIKYMAFGEDGTYGFGIIKLYIEE